MVKATIDNLRNLKASKILVIKNNKIIDFLSKDVNSDCKPYSVIGSDCIDEEDIFERKWVTEECFIVDADKFSFETTQYIKHISTRVSRGGSWNNDAVYARVAYRRNFHPDYHCFLLGFMIAKKQT
jgi:hypothetical protein